MKLPRGIFEKIKDSKVYWIRYTGADGLRHRERAGNLTQAKNKLATRIAERLQGIETEPVSRTLALSSLLDDAIKYVKSENEPRSAYVRICEIERIRSTFKDCPARKVTPQQILDWLDNQTRVHSWGAANRNHYLAAWSLIFRVAIENHKLRENPATKVKYKRQDNSRTRYLSADEELALCRVLEMRFPAYLPVVLLSIHTGMRRSELFRAKVGDLQSGMFMVRQQKVRSAPVTRYVPATRIAQTAYLSLANGREQGKPLCTLQIQRSEAVGLKSTHYWFDSCLKEAGIEDFHWHDLRHTFASRLVMGGVPLAAVAKYMGHSSVSMTMRYAHLCPATHEQVLGILDGMSTEMVTASQEPEKVVNNILEMRRLEK